ncbi:MAG: undecaprenyl-phosphate glucose phosphotransferase [Ignavibacteriae bacterium]|nr:undecaprenyl-phosphate glucose phosphotransferase [Ignavibacteriota bacterium]
MKRMEGNSSRRGDFLIPLLTVLFDCIAIESSFLFSYWLRFRSPFFEYLGYMHGDAPPIEGYLLGSLFIVLIWVMLFNSRKMYSARRNVTLSDEVINIVKVVSLGMLVVMSAAFFYRDFSYSRVVFGLLWFSSIVLIFAGRVVLRSFERRLYRKGRHLQHAIIIGSDSLANEVYTRLNGHLSFGFNVVGYFADARAHEELKLARAAYLGSVSDAPAFIQEGGVELAFIALRSKDHPRLFELIGECEGVNVEFMMVPDVLDILTSQVRVRELEGVPFLRIKGIPLTFWGRVSKRSFDIIVSLLLLIAFSPVWLLIMLLIKLDSRGPVFFKQERVGLDGWKFTMYKFRSMRVGADESDHKAGLGIRNDPRRTRVGVLLRKTSLDELPQLYNVLRGEMSLVGPRPERIKFVEEFQEIVPKYLDRHRVKTGMTGWAQVNGFRGDTSIEERIKYDLYYIENWSLAFDVKILLRTLRAALMAKGVN